MGRDAHRPEDHTPRGQLDREVQEEIDGHFDRLVEELRQRGMSGAAARAEARRRFGDPGRAVRRGRRVRRRRLRGHRRRELWGGLAHDLRSAWRALAARPGFTLTAVVMLAVGSGAAVTTFSVLGRVLLAPLPFRDPGQLYRIRGVPESLTPGVPRSFDQLLDWQYLVDDAFGEMAEYHPAPRAVNLRFGGEPLRATATEVTPGFFNVLGPEVARGRTFGSGDAGEPASAVAVISERLWRDRLGADAGVVGATLTVNGNPYRITGVLAADSSLPAEVDVWVPMAFDVSHMVVRGARYFDVLARARPGVSTAQASASMARFGRWLRQQFPDSTYGELEPEAEPLHDALVSRVRAPIWLLFAATGLILAIGTANVAGYLLARAHARRTEYAVRAALGAGARRLLTRSLGEAAILAAGGAVAGLLLAWWCTGLLRGSTALAIPRGDELSIDAGVVSFSLLLTTITTLGAGLAPAIAAMRPGGRVPGARGRTGVVDGGGSGRTRDALLVVQVALALVLAVAASVLAQSWAALLAVDPGFDDDTLTFSVILDEVAYPSAESRQRFTGAVLERLRDTERVAAAGASVSLPLAEDAIFGVGFSVAGEGEVSENRYAIYLPVTAGYLDAMGIRILAGRSLQERDEQSDAPGLVVNEAFADRYLSARGDVVGTRMTVVDREFTVVGVAANVRRFDLRREVDPAFYLPAGLLGSAPRYFVVHAPGLGLAGLSSVIRDAVHAVDPALPLSELRQLGELRSGQLAQPGLLAAVFAGFAGLGLGLAAFGLYAVLTQWAVARTAETGLRMALGATRGRVVGHFLRQGAVRCLLGCLVGAALYVLGARWLESQLFAVHAYDPATLVVVTAILGSVWLVAMLLPARRAAGLDPALALRSE